MKKISGKQKPLKEKAYNLIKEKIIKCELMPGSDISEAQVAEELGMSRTPVREALLRLEQEKFVNIYPRKGIIVSPISVKDIYEVFQVRQMVEPYIAKASYKKMSKKYLLNMEKKFEEIAYGLEESSRMEFFDLDIEFHKYIIKSGDNDHSIEFMNKIYDLDYRIRVMSTFGRDDIKERSAPEHSAIINALINGDESKIKTTLEQHLESSRKAALKRIY